MLPNLPTDQPIIQPGKDHPVNHLAMQKQVARDLSQLYGVDIKHHQLQPAAQLPVETASPSLLQDPHPESDWDDIMAGLGGKPRTESSKNFLKMLFVRLQKQHPDSDIKQVG